MTQGQYSVHLKKLIAENKIDGSDTSIAIYLPSYEDETLKFNLKIVPFYNGCYLNWIRLTGWSENNEFGVSNIDNLMIQKYGKGIESGYEQFIVDNGRIIDGLYGTVYALSDMKDGEAIVGYRQKKNDETSGRRLWNIKGVKIELFYRKDHIESEYRSLKYLREEKIKEDVESRNKDSMNTLKINNSTKSL